MKILITGGAGYLGHELAVELLLNPKVEQVIIYDNLSSGNFNLFLDTRKFSNGRMRFAQGELLDTRKLRALLKEGVDVVYHLAAKVSTPLGDGDAHLFEQVNHWGTAELVHAVEEAPSVKKFVYLSSISVYGPHHDWIDIDTHPNPKSFYGSSKLRGEAHVLRLFERLPTYIIRCGNVFGFSPSARFDTVLNRFMFEANFVGRIRIEGSGEQQRSFVHINKATNLLHNLFKTEALPSGIYNLVGKNLSVNQVAALIKEIYPKLEMIYVNQHLDMPQLRMRHDERLAPLITMTPQSIEEDLFQFKHRFSFSSFD